MSSVCCCRRARESRDVERKRERKKPTSRESLSERRKTPFSFCSSTDTRPTHARALVSVSRIYSTREKAHISIVLLKKEFPCSLLSSLFSLPPQPAAPPPVPRLGGRPDSDPPGSVQRRLPDEPVDLGGAPEVEARLGRGEGALLPPSGERLLLRRGVVVVPLGGVGAVAAAVFIVVVVVLRLPFLVLVPFRLRLLLLGPLHQLEPAPLPPDERRVDDGDPVAAHDLVCGQEGDGGPPARDERVGRERRRGQERGRERRERGRRRWQQGGGGGGRDSSRRRRRSAISSSGSSNGSGGASGTIILHHGRQRPQQRRRQARQHPGDDLVHLAAEEGLAVRRGRLDGAEDQDDAREGGEGVGARREEEADAREGYGVDSRDLEEEGDPVCFCWF